MGRTIERVDASLQRFFDAIFQWFMRRGVAKKSIRYFIWSCFAIIYLGSLRSLWSWGWGGLVCVILGLLHLFVWGHSIQMDRDNDEQAERRGAASWADTDFRARSGKTMGLLYIGLGTPSLIAYAILGELPPTWDCDLYRIVSGLFGIAGGYLCRTQQPPKASKRAPGFLDGLRNVARIPEA